MKEQAFDRIAPALLERLGLPLDIAAMPEFVARAEPRGGLMHCLPNPLAEAFDDLCTPFSIECD